MNNSRTTIHVLQQETRYLEGKGHNPFQWPLRSPDLNLYDFCVENHYNILT